jgi:hypothetical protein
MGPIKISKSGASTTIEAHARAGTHWRYVHVCVYRAYAHHTTARNAAAARRVDLGKFSTT